MTQAPETCPAELPNWCAQRHWAIFWILIVCSVASVAGRVLVVANDRAPDDTPFFSANDRSRWVTVRALGDHGTYEIDDLIDPSSTIRWDTIDKVKHLNELGQMRTYSSKPPLFPTLVAWKYTLVKSITGWEISEDTFAVVRTLLVLSNVIPWLVYLCFVALMINSVPVRDWTRYYVLACAGFGTYLSTFTVTLNNHLPAAICVMIALYFVSEIWRKSETPWWYYAAAGFFSAAVVANELPGLAFCVLVMLVCAVRSLGRTTLIFVPAALVVAVAFFAANYAAHHDWRPAYAHRSDGPVVKSVEGDFEQQLDRGSLPEEIRQIAEVDFELKLPSVQPGAWPGTPTGIQRWVVRDQVSDRQFAIQSPDGRTFQIRSWDNWYDYPGSYWLTTNNERKSVVDRGQPSTEIYAFHVLFGHHGIFSLTPIWLFSLAGMIAMMFGVKLAGRYSMRWFGLLAIVLSMVVVAFYLSRPAIDRNYGGVSCVLRWALWLTPIWLVSMLPVIDWLAGSRSGKLACYLLLFISTLSAMYAAENPWVHPWLYEVWDWTGLPK